MSGTPMRLVAGETEILSRSDGGPRVTLNGGSIATVASHEEKTQGRVYLGLMGHDGNFGMRTLFTFLTPAQAMGLARDLANAAEEALLKETEQARRAFDSALRDAEDLMRSIM